MKRFSLLATLLLTACDVSSEGLSYQEGEAFAPGAGQLPPPSTTQGTGGTGGVTQGNTDPTMAPGNAGGAFPSMGTAPATSVPQMNGGTGGSNSQAPAPSPPAPSTPLPNVALPAPAQPAAPAAEQPMAPPPASPEVPPTTAPAQPPTTPNPGTPIVAPPAAVPPAVTDVVRAKDVKVGWLRVRRIVAKTLHSPNVNGARIIVRKDDKQWERERNDEDITTAELVADTLYAKDIRADRVEADEIVVQEYRSN